MPRRSALDPWVQVIHPMMGNVFWWRDDAYPCTVSLRRAISFWLVHLQNNWDGGEVFSCGSELDAAIDLLPKSDTVIGALSELKWHTGNGVEHDVTSLNKCRN